MIVFGILKRNGRIYTVVVDNAKSETVLPVIKKKIMPDSIVYTDSLSSYDKLDVSGFIHYRINHCGIGVEFRANPVQPQKLKSKGRLKVEFQTAFV